MEESVLLGTKPPVDFIRHSIRDPSGVFSVCHPVKTLTNRIKVKISAGVFGTSIRV